MSFISIQPCTAADGPAIGALNVRAFWTDRTWVRMWPGRTREYMAAQGERRGTHMLLSNRRQSRHLKAVDTADGNRVVGYARWKLPNIIPPAHGQGQEKATQRGHFSYNSWPEAQVPEVSDDERQQAQMESDAADWDFDRALDVLDPPMIDMKDRLMRYKHYVCRFRYAEAQKPQVLTGTSVGLSDRRP